MNFIVSLAAAAAMMVGAQGYKVAGSAFPAAGYDQSFLEEQSPLKFVANIGPYSSRPGSISPDTPAGCKVDQVVLLSRHGERYPSLGDAKDHIKVLQKIKSAHPKPFVGDLAFLNDWKYYLDGHLADAGVMISQGAYSGLADLYHHGSTFRGKYGHLWDKQSKLPIFTSGSERVVESGRYFGEGFLGYNYTDLAAVNIIPEWDNRGGDSLAISFCNSTDADTTSCGKLKKSWPQFELAAGRLNAEYNLGLDATDIYNLIELSAFDVILEGSSSPWQNVFTADEWTTFEYVRSLEFYCENGPGSNAARAMGNVFFNATATLLQQGPEHLPISLNFAHDTDVSRAVSGAGIIPINKNLSTEKVVFNSGYNLADVVPMGARLVIERLNCKAPYLTNSTDLISSNYTAPSNFSGTAGPVNNITSYFPASNSSSSSPADSLFVRVILNDAVIPLEFGYEGPGYSCSLSKFTEHIAEQTKKYDYSEICKPGKLPTSYSFWWSWNTSTAMNYPNGSIPAYNNALA